MVAKLKTMPLPRPCSKANDWPSVSSFHLCPNIPGVRKLAPGMPKVPLPKRLGSA